MNKKTVHLEVSNTGCRACAPGRLTDLKTVPGMQIKTDHQVPADGPGREGQKSQTYLNRCLYLILQEGVCSVSEQST